MKHEKNKNRKLQNINTAEVSKLIAEANYSLHNKSRKI